MRTLTCVNVSTETMKEAKKEFDIPTASITPVKKEVTKNGVTTVEVTTGSLNLSDEAVKVFNLSTGDTLSVSEAEGELFFYKSTLIDIAPQLKKGLTKAWMLRLSSKNFNRIYSDYSLTKTDAWFFRLEQCTVDLGDVKDVAVFVLHPLERRA